MNANGTGKTSAKSVSKAIQDAPSYDELKAIYVSAKGNDESAIDILEKWAEKGLPSAQLFYSDVLLNTLDNYDKGKRYLTKAVRNGEADGYFSLFTYYVQNINAAEEYDMQAVGKICNYGIESGGSIGKRRLKECLRSGIEKNSILCLAYAVENSIDDFHLAEQYYFLTLYIQSQTDELTFHDADTKRNRVIKELVNDCDTIKKAFDDSSYGSVDGQLIRHEIKRIEFVMDRVMSIPNVPEEHKEIILAGRKKLPFNPYTQKSTCNVLPIPQASNKTVLSPEIAEKWRKRRIVKTTVGIITSLVLLPVACFFFYKADWDGWSQMLLATFLLHLVPSVFVSFFSYKIPLKYGILVGLSVGVVVGGILTLVLWGIWGITLLLHIPWLVYVILLFIFVNICLLLLQFLDT